MQRLRSQDSLKVGLTAAVSDLAFIRSDLPVNPHFMGNTDLLPDRFGAMTGTTSVGRISPRVLTWVFSCHFLTSEERFISSTIARSSGDSSAQ